MKTAGGSTANQMAEDQMDDVKSCYCTGCGLAVKENDEFCPRCGKNRHGPSLAQSEHRCPYCAEVVHHAARKCKHCGEILDPQLRLSRQRSWNPGIAAVLSLFVPGAGQMYKGKIGAGIIWLFVTVPAYFLFVVPALVIHLVCICDAAAKGRGADADP